MKSIFSTAFVVLATLTQAQAAGSFYKATITVTNDAPVNGTCLTPVWVGIHDGTFDVYDRDAAASPALERIAEDGNAGPLMADFAAAAGGVWDGVVGSAPICPGQTASVDAVLFVNAGTKHYLSYTSMILPSNDAFVANGNPMAFEIFDDAATFVPVSFTDSGDDVLDAGTEVNDEVPANTAFFGQAAPDTGVDEGGVVTTHPGFIANGPILSDIDFANADFKAPGYEVMSVSVTATKLEAIEGTITVYNMAPSNGTCMTPVWVGIHDGVFDTYNGNEPVRASIERLAEDGNNAPLIEEFNMDPGALWDGVVGSAPLCPGEEAELTFKVPKLPGGKPYYFSYASMVLPSNDAWVSNGNPMAYEVISDAGELVPVIVEDPTVLDAGTEVNDELPANTAFFGQQAPDTGVTENGVVVDHPGFMAKGSGGILDDPQFANADFTADGYEVLKITVTTPTPDMPSEPTSSPTYSPTPVDDSSATGRIAGFAALVMAVGLAILI